MAVRFRWRASGFIGFADIVRAERDMLLLFFGHPKTAKPGHLSGRASGIGMKRTLVDGLHSVLAGVLFRRGLLALLWGRWLVHDTFQRLALGFHANVAVACQHLA